MQVLPIQFWHDDWEPVERDVSDRTGEFIGGSDVPVIMGENPYKTPLMLYYEKKGLWKAEETEPMVIGKEIEEFIVHMFEKRSGYSVYSLPAIKKEPFIVHVDGIAINQNGDLAIVEIKNLNAFNKNWEYYYWQLLAYMHALDIHHGFLSILIGGNKFITQEYYYDEGDAKKMLTKVNEFLAMLRSNTPPDPVGNANEYKTLVDILSDTEGIIKSDELDTLVLQLDEVKSQKKELEKEERRLKALITQMMEEKGATVIVGKEHIAELKTYRKRVVDTEAAKGLGAIKEIEYKQLRISKGGMKDE